MIIAIATDGDNVSEHFGRCEYFTLCDIQNGKVTARKVIGTEGNQRGALPGYLHGLGVNAVISGGAGSGAIQKCNQLGIEILSGVQCSIDGALNSYLKGELKCNSASVDDEHKEHRCGGNCR